MSDLIPVPIFDINKTRFRWKDKHKHSHAQNWHLSMEGPSAIRLALLLGGVGPERDSICGCIGGGVTACTCRLQLFKKRVQPHERILKKYSESIDWLYSMLTDDGKIRHVPIEQVAMSYTGRKRQIYLDCAASYRRYGLGRMSFRWFPKRYERNDPEKPRDRAILPQMSMQQTDGENKGARWMPLPILLELAGGRFAQERSMHKLVNDDGSPMTTCGMSQREIAQLIMSQMKTGVRCLSFDISSFDGSLGPLAAKERLAFLKHTHIDRDLRRVIDAQMKSELGGDVSVDIPGIRQSGTAGTGLANKLCMLAILRAAAGTQGYRRYLVAGDDALLFVKDDDYQRYGNSWSRKFLDLGLQVKLVGNTMDFREVEFCRSQITLGRDGWVLTKIPIDALRVVLNQMRHLKGPHLLDYLTTVGRGYSELWKVPVHHELGLLLMSAGGRDRPELLGNSGLDYLITKQGKDSLKTRSISVPEMRESYFLTFGVPPADQIKAEAELRLLSKDFRNLLLDFIGR